MPSFVGDLIPVVALILLGAVLGRIRFLGDSAIDALKRLVSSVSLPALLFVAFSRLRPQGAHFVLAAAIFISCGVLGLVGAGLSRLFSLPRPGTRLLFQGFEAGMLGYALFASFFGRQHLASFAAADLGQVVFVFTVLMAQLRSDSGQGGSLGSLFLGMARSPVIIAIAAGLLSALLVPEAVGLPWGPGGLLEKTLDLIGGITTPLVCLVVGQGLGNGFRGARAAVAASLLRLGSSLALGALVAFALVPALGFPRIVSVAVLCLFVLPPPFVIPIFRSRADEAAYVSSVLSIHTLLSLGAFAAVAALAG